MGSPETVTRGPWGVEGSAAFHSFSEKGSGLQVQRSADSAYFIIYKAAVFAV